ncbi:MAG TPA: flavodoxin family protein [Candidatus Deferrimicrobium sp.]|nr:flavodoxin family protein [Candidatus Deferrimicrobium sp.]
MAEQKKISILGISGSPRIGSTDYIINEALNHAKTKLEVVETDYFSVHGKKINFCIHCDYCLKNKEGCVHKDDMNELYPKLIRANAYIIGSPVYQGNISGQLKTVFDRCRALVAKDPNVFQDKVGIAIAVGGDRVGGQEITIHTILDFYLINGILAVSGGFFGANLGGTVWSKDKGALGAQEDSEGVKTVHKSVNKLIKLARKVL